MKKVKRNVFKLVQQVKSLNYLDCKMSMESWNVQIMSGLALLSSDVRFSVTSVSICPETCFLALCIKVEGHQISDQ